jgi:hypothetical protein
MTRMTIKRRILVISDLQVPFHLPAAVKSLTKLVRREKFDQILCVGDEIDFDGLSKWARGTHLEWEGRLDADREACRQILWDLGVTDVTRSNHTDRLYHTLLRAPGLIGLPELDYPKFMGFDELGIKYHRKPYEFLPNWVLVHGDEGSLNRNAGGTAAGLANKFGANVVCGHTHRLGLQGLSQGFKGRFKTLWGFEVGNLMDSRQASYLKAGSANWQGGFGIIEVHGKNVTCIPVPVNQDGSFTIYGKIYN